MNTGLLLMNILLVIATLLLAFLVLGALRALGLLTWRLEQLEATRPSRLGRDGLKVGGKAPDFILPNAAGGRGALSDFAGRKVLLVFTQSGCGPCHKIMPELKSLQENGEYQVLVVNNGEPESTRQLTTGIAARFPVLVQEKFSLSKRYEVFATPFAFVIDEQGTIASKGIVGNRQYLGYVLSGAGNRSNEHHDDPEQSDEENGKVETTFNSKEITHA